MSRGEGQGCRSYQAILLLHVPVGHLPSPPQHDKAELLPSATAFCRTIASHFSTSQVRRATGTRCHWDPLCTEGLGRIPSDFAIPKGQALFTNPSSIQISLYTSSPTTEPSISPEKMKFPPGSPPGILQTEQCFLSWQSRIELTQKLHVWCDRPTKMSSVCGQSSLIPWRSPWEGPVSWGHQTLC